MFGKKSRAHEMSQGKNFEGVEILMQACDYFDDAVKTITDSDFCLASMHRNYLHRSASRMAALEAIAEQDIVCISASDRYRVGELANEINEFRQF